MEHTINKEGFDQWMNSVYDFSEQTVTNEEPVVFVATCTDNNISEYWVD